MYPNAYPRIQQIPGTDPQYVGNPGDPYISRGSYVGMPDTNYYADAPVAQYGRQVYPAMQRPPEDPKQQVLSLVTHMISNPSQYSREEIEQVNQLADMHGIDIPNEFDLGKFAGRTGFSVLDSLLLGALPDKWADQAFGRNLDTSMNSTEDMLGMGLSMFVNPWASLGKGAARMGIKALTKGAVKYGDDVTKAVNELALRSLNTRAFKALQGEATLAGKAAGAETVGAAAKAVGIADDVVAKGGKPLTDALKAGGYTDDQIKAIMSYGEDVRKAQSKGVFDAFEGASRLDKPFKFSDEGKRAGEYGYNVLQGEEKKYLGTIGKYLMKNDRWKKAENIAGNVIGNLPLAYDVETGETDVIPLVIGGLLGGMGKAGSFVGGQTNKLYKEGQALGMVPAKEMTQYLTKQGATLSDDALEGLNNILAKAGKTEKITKKGYSEALDELKVILGGPQTAAKKGLDEIKTGLNNAIRRAKTSYKSAQKKAAKEAAEAEARAAKAEAAAKRAATREQRVRAEAEAKAARAEARRKRAEAKANEAKTNAGYDPEYSGA